MITAKVVFKDNLQKPNEYIDPVISIIFDEKGTFAIYNGIYNYEFIPKELRRIDFEEENKE